MGYNFFLYFVKMKIFPLLLLFSLYLGLAKAQNPKITEPVKKAMDQVNPDQIKADITYLADDKLKGRLPGTEGYKMAMDYVEMRLKNLGVIPAGENGSWTQTVRFKRSFLQNQNMNFTWNSFKGIKPLDSIKYLIYPNPVEEHSLIPASDLVFAGFGISEPALNFDDYANLDVKGKVVLIIRGAPDMFSSSVKAYSMSMDRIIKVAGAHGAIGVLLGIADSTRKNMPNISHGMYHVVDEKGKVMVSGTYSSNLRFTGVLSYTTFNYLLQNSGKTISGLLSQLKSGHNESFELPLKISADYHSHNEDVLSYNVVGKIIGSDPVLRNEYVVHSAHLDHLGVRNPPILGDSIYNGAHDNASGVASLLAIAGIYHNIPVKTKRSILVVLVTGEELGDLGSGYFARKPVVPVKKLVADVNTDMPTIIAPLLSVTAMGAEHSSLSNQVDWAAGQLGLTVEPDPEPNEARFTRSDQYSFVLAGIPALHIKYGNRTPDGKNNLFEKVAVWRAKYYHKPQDDINGIFDFEAGKKYAQLNFLIGYGVAQNPTRPTWNKGDIFENQGDKN